MANDERPHMFIKELKLYTDYLRAESRKVTGSCTVRTQEYLSQFKMNMLSGIAHYQRIADHLADQKTKFMEDLRQLRLEIDAIEIPSCSLPLLPNQA